ncbi:MAG: exodeoxyribonuclease VII large subunit [Desulfovibrio sp.]|nr:exodeoxyribonuclease VII large subunit [Desulfovibrio sp.]
MEEVYTVSSLTEEIRKGLERRFPYVWVRGEATNLSVASSGHIYFSLKDGSSQLQCVWFSGKHKNASRNFDPLTGEVFDSPAVPLAEQLRNGLEILASGAIGVYAARGQYQLLVDYARPAGAGLLALEFEKRKAKLAGLGYFAPERKRPLPREPRRIALVTSARGAAIHDFMELASVRGLGSNIRLFNVPVQGKEAPEKIARAIALAGNQDWAQVIVVIRGGGSMEDLWAFNEEAVAEAIYNSPVPVLAGIGHEVDISLADMTADLRAATPSHAAQLLWSPRAELWQKLDELTADLARSASARLETLTYALAQKSRMLSILTPLRKINESLNKISDSRRGLLMAAKRAVRARQEKLAFMDKRFRMARNPAREISDGEEALAAFVDMMKKAREERIVVAGNKLLNLESGLKNRISAVMNRIETKLDRASSCLKALNPRKPFKLGYALLSVDGHRVRSIDDCAIGDKVTGELIDGKLIMTADAKEKESEG